MSKQQRKNNNTKSNNKQKKMNRRKKKEERPVSKSEQTFIFYSNDKWNKETEQTNKSTSVTTQSNLETPPITMAGANLQLLQNAHQYSDNHSRKEVQSFFLFVLLSEGFVLHFSFHVCFSFSLFSILIGFLF